MESIITIEGEEKTRYLNQLDNALESLAKNLALELNPRQSDFLKEFGENKKWDWSRLPTQDNTYKQISKLIERIREEYKLFSWQDFHNNPAKNMGYFEKLDLSTESGLPFAFEFVELHRLKKESNLLLDRMLSYQDAGQELRRLLLEDYVEIQNVESKSREIHKNAMKRNFLESLQNTTLLGWESTKYSLPPIAKKLMPMGIEDLWNVVCAKYLKSSSMFEIYVIDLWQDRRDPQIQDTVRGEGKVSYELENTLMYSSENAAWFILREIDEKFPSIHPVHVSRALIGPFENKYSTKIGDIKQLPITQELLTENINTGLLRFSRQYSYAPNHEVIDDVFKQVVYRENWSDEVIVSPSSFSSRVAGSILGTNVRVFKY